jgi:two-component system, NarL family, response regulator DegU
MIQKQIIKVVAADNHAIVRLGLDALLTNAGNIFVAATVGEGRKIIAEVKKHQPDVVIMETEFPDVSGIAIVKEIAENYPDTRVLLYSSHDSEENILEGFIAGASAFLAKIFQANEIIDAVKTLGNGEMYINCHVGNIFLNDFFSKKKCQQINEKISKILSDREIEIVTLIGQGFSNDVIAEKTNISVRTAETHKYNIMKKLNIKNTVTLVKFALKNNIVAI